MSWAPRQKVDPMDALAPWTLLLYRARMRSLALVLVAAVGCSSSSPGGRTQADYDPDVARYRLLLRHNPEDPGEAFRCYGRCQAETTPGGYLSCLTECPAFEATVGVACSPSEVPPIAACITARRAPTQKDELGPGYLVLAVIANIALIVGASAVCNSSPNCSTGAFYYLPGQLPVSGPGRF